MRFEIALILMGLILSSGQSFAQTHEVERLEGPDFEAHKREVLLHTGQNQGLIPKPNTCASTAKSQADFKKCMGSKNPAPVVLGEKRLEHHK